MLKKKSDIVHRPWNLLRLTLLWARNSCAFKRKFMMDRSLFPKFLKSLGCSSEHGEIIHYKEQELSFENTPITHIKMHRPTSVQFQMPRIPCINPHIDFDCDFPNNDNDNDNNDDDDDMCHCNEGARKSLTSMQFQMPRIPCINPHIDFDSDLPDINPHIDFDCDFPDNDNDNDNDDNNNDDMSYCNEGARKSFLMISNEDDNGSEVCEETINRGDEGIDVKAGQFIAKFYEQMKLQRQISHVEYYEMLNRGTN